jgi:hypothetical protein
LTEKRIKLNISGCAHCAEGRIGEAQTLGLAERFVNPEMSIYWPR